MRRFAYVVFGFRGAVGTYRCRVARIFMHRDAGCRYFAGALQSRNTFTTASRSVQTSPLQSPTIGLTPPTAAFAAKRRTPLAGGHHSTTQSSASLFRPPIGRICHGRGRFRVLQSRAELGIAVGEIFPQTQTTSGSATSHGVSTNVANRVATPTRWFGQWDYGFNVGWELEAALPQGSSRPAARRFRRTVRRRVGYSDRRRRHYIRSIPGHAATDHLRPRDAPPATRVARKSPPPSTKVDRSARSTSIRDKATSRPPKRS